MKQLNNQLERCYDNAFGEKKTTKKTVLFLSTSALRARMQARRLRLHGKVNVYDKISTIRIIAAQCVWV